jgi:hypothetical protein
VEELLPVMDAAHMPVLQVPINSAFRLRRTLRIDVDKMEKNLVEGGETLPLRGSTMTLGLTMPLGLTTRPSMRRVGLSGVPRSSSYVCDDR